MNYRDYVENIVNPRKTKADEPNLDLRNQINKKIKAQSREYYYDFFKQGKPGAKLKNDFDKVCKAMDMQKSVLEDLGIQIRRDGDDGEERALPGGKDSIADLFSDGKAFIFPSFFHTMLTLKKQKRDFRIVFRTFGSDTLNVISEYNRFCEGTHPAYNGRNNNPLALFNGTKGSRNFILEPDHIGLIHRHNHMNEMAIVMGTVKKQLPGQNQTLEEVYAEEMAEKPIEIIKGYKQIYDKILSMTDDKASLAFVDDYHYWKKYDEKQHSAKLTIIDESDHDILQIFFDESIN